jgi:hypothetical protein
VDAWLSARCFDPGAARLLADAGVGPADARMKTGAGAGAYTETIGFKVAAGDIDPEEAPGLVEAIEGSHAAFGSRGGAR